MTVTIKITGMTGKVNIMTEESSTGDPARSLQEVIAARFASLRKARGLSFDQLSARCGVSKGMLVQAEQGRANPSIATLCRIASGLGVSVAELVEVAHSGHRPARIVAPGEAPTLWTGPFGGTACLLVGSDGPEMLEQWAWELRPCERFEAQAHSPGTQELLHVLEGKLTLEIDDARYLIEAGGAAHVWTDRDHAYACTADTAVRFVMTVFEPGGNKTLDPAMTRTGS